MKNTGKMLLVLLAIAILLGGCTREKESYCTYKCCDKDDNCTSYHDVRCDNEPCVCMSGHRVGSCKVRTVIIEEWTSGW